MKFHLFDEPRRHGSHGFFFGRARARQRHDSHDLRTQRSHDLCILSLYTLVQPPTLRKTLCNAWRDSKIASLFLDAPHLGSAAAQGSPFVDAPLEPAAPGSLSLISNLRRNANSPDSEGYRVVPWGVQSLLGSAMPTKFYDR